MKATTVAQFKEHEMKRTVATIFCLASTITLAQDTNDVDVSDADHVDLRVSVIESIVVTAEKLPSANTEEADEDVAAILDEAEESEEEQTSE